MKDAHAHLNIREKEWNVMAAEFKKSLNKHKVPAAEQQEPFAPGLECEHLTCPKPSIPSRWLFGDVSLTAQRT